MTWRELRDWSFALGLGAGGGVLFAWAGLPLPWMLGALTATTVAALAGAPMRVPQSLRAVMIGILGLMLGSTFTPDIVEQAGRWAVSLGALVVYIVLTTALVVLYFRRLGHGLATSYFAAAPGGLSEMTLTGAAMGGDDRVIALTHTLRIVIIVLTVPVAFRLFGGYHAPQIIGAAGGLASLGGVDAAWLAATGIAGAVLGRALRLPAPALTGAMFLSAASHLAGLTESRPPGELVALAQVVTGSAIGCRFAGLPLRRLAPVAAAAAGSTGIMLGLGLAAAAALAGATGLPAVALLLAFVPGGLAEMCLISLALGVDVAFVSTHHVVRILLVVILAPTAWRLLHRPKS